MRMSILLYDGFTTLDIVGGYESLARIPNMRMEFVATEVGIYAADTRALGLYAWKTLEDAKGTDILYVPGGLGVYAAQRDSRILDFIRKSHETTTWTVGICNGVEILANAGILDGVEVTTNYFARDRVAKARRQGAEDAVSPRWEGHCHVNFGRMNWSLGRRPRTHHVACRVHVSLCQTSNVTDRIARYASAAKRCRRG